MPVVPIKPPTEEPMPEVDDMFLDMAAAMMLKEAKDEKTDEPGPSAS